MAKNAEANLLLKIKREGEKALKATIDEFEDIRNKAALAATAIAGFVGLSVKKYGEKQEILLSLTRSIENQGLEVAALSKRYIELAESLKESVNVDDDAILKGIALAQSYAGQLELTEDLIEATVNFAVATEKDMVTAFELVGKSIGTNNNLLVRSGVELDATADASEKMAKITDVLSKKYDGWAKATGAVNGGTKKLLLGLEDVTEELGKEFSPNVEEATGHLNKLIKAFLDNRALIQWTASIIAIVGAATAMIAGISSIIVVLPTLGTALGIAAGAAATFWAAISGPIGLAVLGIGSLAVGIARVAGAFDGLTGSAKKANDEIANTSHPKNDGGREGEDERYLRAVHMAEKESQAKVKIHKETVKDIAKIDDGAAKERLIAQEEAWEEMKALKAEFDDERRIEEENLENAALDRSRLKFENFLSAMNGLATGGFQGIIGGVIQTIGDAYIPGLGSMIKSFFDLFAQDAETFKVQVQEMFSTTFMDSLVSNAFLFSETFFENLPELFDKAITEIIAQSPKHTAAITKTVLSEEFIGGLIKSIVMGVVDGIKGAGSDIGEAFRKAITDALTQGDKAKEIGKNVSSFVKGAGKLMGFASGGMVPNIQRFAAGGTVDTVPAMLSPGEFVVNRDSAQKNLGLLQSINSGSGGGGTTINLTINGGFLGDDKSARQLAKAIDEQLLKLRQGNQSVAFDSGVF